MYVCVCLCTCLCMTEGTSALATKPPHQLCPPNLHVLPFLQMLGSPDKRYMCLGPASGFSDHYGELRAQAQLLWLWLAHWLTIQACM